MKKIYELNDNDKEYPQKLLKIKNHPKKIYVIGNKKILNNKSVAIVGTRDNTSYGEYYCSQFSKKISKCGITVVSGLAVGIDAIAHKNSLKENGRTIAVIGSGFNNIYPPENKSLFYEIIKSNGTVISEYPPEDKANLKKFPLRNRIIAGLSECTIVIEAKFRSGSSITAKYAFEQGKNVYCLPGRIEDKTSRGTNILLNKGAIAITSINDILNKFGKEEITKVKQFQPKIDKEYIEIYKKILKKTMNINELSQELKIGIQELNIKLTIMEMKGYIKIMPGNIVKIKE